MIVKIREDIDMKISNEKAIFSGFINGELTKLSNDKIKILKSLFKGIKTDSIEKLKGNSLFDFLYSKNFLVNIDENSNKNDQWYSHFDMLGNIKKFQKSNSNILILGLGGTGSIIAEHLIRGGFLNLTLLDYGILDESDLNRQLAYTREDLGLKKSVALKNHLLKIRPDAILNIIDKKINRIEDLPPLNPSFIFSCIDEPKYEISKIIAQLSIKTGAPTLFGNVGISDYTVGPLLNSEQSCISFSQFIDKISKKSNNDNIIQASHCSINTIASADIFGQFLQFLKMNYKCPSYNKILLKHPFSGTDSVIKSFDS